MSEIFHVTDPKFWRELGRDEELPSTTWAPQLGARMINIVLNGRSCAVSGGMVDEVKLMEDEDDKLAVSVHMKNAPRPFTLRVEQGFGNNIEFHTSTQQWIIYRGRSKRDSRSVVFDFSMDRPDVVVLSSFHEYLDPEQTGFKTDVVSAELSLGDLVRINATTRFRRVAGGIAIPIQRWLDHSKNKAEKIFVFFSPVRPHHLLDASQAVLRFARFVKRSKPPVLSA